MAETKTGWQRPEGPDAERLRSWLEAAALPTSRGVYGYVCTQCFHPSSQHLLAEDGDLRDGPYLCPCGCGRAQQGPDVGLSATRFAEFQAMLP